MMKRLSRPAVMMMALLMGITAAKAGDLPAWPEIEAKAKGKPLYIHAWGGDPRTNAYLDWVGERLKASHEIELTHVKLTDTAEAVARVSADKASGNDDSGAIDLIWINGPNFLAMKQNQLLFGPFVKALPNSRYVDLSPNAPASLDFTVPVDGLEAPWRLARFAFFYDSARIKAADLPRAMADFPEFAAKYKGRFTHPVAGNFMGASFLKQALVALSPDRAALLIAPTEDSYQAQSAILWQWYERLRPHLWRGGKSFPATHTQMEQMVGDGELVMGISFDPSSAAAGIEEGRLPPSVRVLMPEEGTLGNVSFLAIPYNSPNWAASMVAVNFMLSPAAQARQQDIRVLGSYNVLDMDKLSAAQKALFSNLPRPEALPDPAALGKTLPEPHPDWMDRLAEDWQSRYGH